MLKLYVFVSQEGDAASGGRVVGVARDAAERRARVAVARRLRLRGDHTCQVNYYYYSKWRRKKAFIRGYDAYRTKNRQANTHTK